MNNKNKSFTLIELLVVIVIIGILAGVIMISTSSSIQKANIAKSKVFAESIKNNLMLSLISEWNFDNVSLPYRDSWGDANCSLIVPTGVTSPEIKINDCISNSCLFFGHNVFYNENGSYLNCGSLSNSTDIWTIDLWIKTSYDGRMPLSIGNAIIYPNAGIAWPGNYWYPDIGNVCDNKWHHLAFTYSGTKLINENNVFVYVDGKLITQANKSWTSIQSPIYIGRGHSWGSSTYPYRGLIDEISVYNDYISTSQIKQNYIAGLNSMLANGNISKQEYNERINALAYDN